MNTLLTSAERELAEAVEQKVEERRAAREKDAELRHFLEGRERIRSTGPGELRPGDDYFCTVHGYVRAAPLGGCPVCNWNTATSLPSRVGNPQDVLRTLPSDPGERKAAPIGSGVVDYFPAALAEVARLSKAGNDQHNPGQPLHWARGKSSDHWDCILRHGIERGAVDSDGMRHTAKLAWRALALLQEELETEAGFVPAGEGAAPFNVYAMHGARVNARPGGSTDKWAEEQGFPRVNPEGA